jgi:hypothetical protein
MAVQIKYTFRIREYKERYERSNWLIERIPSQEFLLTIPESPDDDGWDIDDHVTTTVTIWDEDASKIATEFWFRFP